MIMTIKRDMPPKIQMGVGEGSGHKFQLIKKNQNHDSQKLIFDIFENFTNHGESI
jgi:hypothetical protein